MAYNETHINLALRKIKNRDRMSMLINYLDVLILAEAQGAIVPPQPSLSRPRPLIYATFMSIAFLCLTTIYLSAFHGNNPAITLILDLMFLSTMLAWVFLRYTGRLAMQIA